MSCLKNEYFPLKMNSFKTSASLDIKSEAHIENSCTQERKKKKKDKRNAFGIICVERRKAVLLLSAYLLAQFKRGYAILCKPLKQCIFMYNYWWVYTAIHLLVSCHLVIYILFTFRLVCKLFTFRVIKMLCHCSA